MTRGPHPPTQGIQLPLQRSFNAELLRAVAAEDPPASAAAVEKFLTCSKADADAVVDAMSVMHHKHAPIVADQCKMLRALLVAAAHAREKAPNLGGVDEVERFVEAVRELITKAVGTATQKALLESASPRVRAFFVWPEFAWLYFVFTRASCAKFALTAPPDENPWDEVRAEVELQTPDQIAEIDRDVQAELARILERTTLVDDCIAAHGRRIGAQTREDFRQEIKAAAIAGIGFDTPRRKRGRGAGRPRSPAWALRTLPGQLKATRGVVRSEGGSTRRPRSVASDAPTANDVRDEADDFLDAIDATAAVHAIQRLANVSDRHPAERALMLEFAATRRTPAFRELARRTGLDKSTLSRHWPRVRERISCVPGVAAMLDA